MALILIASAALLFLATAWAGSREPTRIIGHGLVKFKGKGPEAWHWRYQVEKRRRIAAENRHSRGWKRDVAYAIALASSTFRVSSAAMWNVAHCETGGTFNPNARNHSSSASGLFQFLDSTWRAQGMVGFSVFDPVANALATARIVARQGWRQWSCQP